jgi:hypothetical protein
MYIMKQTNAQLIDSLLYCSLSIETLNKEQYNKLSINCAFVCLIMYIVKDARNKG